MTKGGGPDLSSAIHSSRYANSLTIEKPSRQENYWITPISDPEYQKFILSIPPERLF